MPESAVVLGLDIGGTKTHAAAFDDRYNVITELRKPTAAGGGESIAAQVVETIGALKQRLAGRSVATVGIGIPGLVDRSAGSVRQAVNLGIADTPVNLVARVADAHGVACHVDNDVNVAALGTHRLLRNRTVSDLAYLSIGTGIAAGVILDGRIHRGRRGVAGEIGHLPMSSEGTVCECGLRGCLETIASGAAIARRWPSDGPASPTESLIAAAEAGDTKATVILRDVEDHLARAVYLLAITYDVDRVVIGGGVADLDHLLLDTIRSGLARLEEQSGFVRSLELPTRMVLKPPGPVAAIGAATLTEPLHRS